MTNNGVLRQLADLKELDIDALRDRWRDLYGSEPPAYRRDVLIRRLAYRIQELAYGGITEATRARLRAHLEEIGEDSVPNAKSPTARRGRSDGMPVVGTVLVRQWGGERHEVTIVAGGVEYRGRPYRSLSAVAREITATRWNGPLFFGLRKQKRPT